MAFYCRFQCHLMEGTSTYLIVLHTYWRSRRLMDDALNWWCCIFTLRVPNASSSCQYTHIHSFRSGNLWKESTNTWPSYELQTLYFMTGCRIIATAMPARWYAQLFYQYCSNGHVIHSHWTKAPNSGLMMPFGINIEVWPKYHHTEYDFFTLYIYIYLYTYTDGSLIGTVSISGPRAALQRRRQNVGHSPTESGTDFWALCTTSATLGPL